MSDYALGIDLGTTYSAAAIGRGAAAQPMTLGTETAQMPTVVLLRADGEVLVGDAAERRASAEPTRAAREFKRRLGDPVPVVVGGVPHTVPSLMGHVVRDIIARATQQEGRAPSVVVLTHPANYSAFKTGALREVAALAGIEPTRLVLLTEPEAAAVAYTRQQPIEPGEIVTVYDFGGGTFDAASVGRTDTGFELVGMPEGMERLGGIDFDQAVLAHVDRVLGGLVTGADRADPQTLVGQARLRAECRRAKEALSIDSDTVIHVALPGVQTEVRLARDEFEAMVRPRVAETVRAMERSIASIGVRTDQISRVLLVGGTSRMPIVSEMVRSATGRPVALDAHPKLSIAIGAALVGAAAVPADVAPVGAAGFATPPVGPAWQPPVRTAPVVPPSPAPSGPRRGRRVLVAALAAVVGAAVVAGVVVLGGGSDEAGKDEATVDTAAPAPTTVPVVVTADPPVTTSAPEVTETTATEPTIPATTMAPPPPPPPSGRGVDAPVQRAAFGGAPGAGVPGPALQAGVSGITALAIDAQGALAVATAEATVVRIADGQAVLVATLDPTSGAGGGIVIATDGTVFVSTRAGIVAVRDGATTVVVDPAAAGLGVTPGPVTVDGLGNLYFADNDTHRIIRRGTDGALSVVAGTGVAATSIAGDGQVASSVPIGTVSGLAIDRSGSLLFADSTLLAVRAVSATGVLSTVAGSGATPLGAAESMVADGTPARSVAFASVDGLAVDGGGRVYVADTSSGAIVRIEPDGTLRAVITRRAAMSPGASPDDVPARESSVGDVGALTTDAGGALWFRDGLVVRRIAGL